MQYKLDKPIVVLEWDDYRAVALNHDNNTTVRYIIEHKEKDAIGNDRWSTVCGLSSMLIEQSQFYKLFNFLLRQKLDYGKACKEYIEEIDNAT